MNKLKSDLIEVLRIPRSTLLTNYTPIESFAVSDSYPDLAKKIIFFQTDYVKCYYLQVWLDLLEKEFGAFTKKLSGKRSDELNKKVKGSKTSAHLYKDERAAIDFFMSGIDMEKVYKYIIDRFIFGECLYYKKKNFIHLTLPFRNNLMQYNIV